MIEIKQAKGVLGRRAFIQVAFDINGKNPKWIPPLRISVFDRLSPKHPAMSHQKTALWIAKKDGKRVGRIGCCIDETFNQYQNCSWAWFGFFDCIDDQEVANELFRTADQWAKLQGATEAIGPANFTTNDELGLLVEEFEDPPTILTLENPPYYENLWTSAGWEQTMDVWAWHQKVSETVLSERQLRTLERIKQRAKVRIRELDTKNWNQEVGRFFEVYNAAWSKNWGFAPMSETEVRHLAKQLKQIIEPSFAFGLESESGEPLAVCLALPDFNQVMHKIRSGRLFPTGWWKLLRGRKHINRIRVWAVGIRPEYQNRGFGPILYQEFIDRALKDPLIEDSEASWTLATNTAINNQMKGMGATRTKTWRLYKKQL